MVVGAIAHTVVAENAAPAVGELIYGARAARGRPRVPRPGARVSHPTSRLDPAIHQPTRLGILTAVCETKRVDFVSLRDLLDLTDGNLSRHLKTLENAGYLKLDKTYEGRRPRTWISATRAGRKALAAEIATLREIVAAADPQRAPAPRPATT